MNSPRDIESLSWSQHSAPLSRRQGVNLLILLCAANALNFGDRLLIGLIQEPLRQEFRLSDFEVGLLGGPAFALFYTLMGIPIARLAERSNRLTIISMAVALWSSMTLFCGLAATYLQLFLARVGVSIGEAGCAPPAHSLISEHFPPDRRAGAMSIYQFGAPLGALVVSLGGGVLAQSYGWRAPFYVFGALGLVLALTLSLTLKDPRQSSGAPIARSNFGEALRLLMGKASFRRVTLGAALTGFGSFFIFQYLSSFLMRSHGLSLSQAAVVVGLAGGVSSALGTLLSGWLTNRLARNTPAAPVLVTAGGLFMAACLFLLAFLSANLAVVIGALMAASFFLNFYMGLSNTAIQGVAPAHMRATASALFIVANSLIGFGLGPPALGALSDAIAGFMLPEGLDPSSCAAPAVAACAAAKAQGLQWAMVAATLPVFVSVGLYWRARVSYGKELIP